MNNGGDAAEIIVRLYLEGLEWLSCRVRALRN